MTTCIPVSSNERALTEAKEPRVLFLVEGNTDIRFVTGLSRICLLTMAVPAVSYRESGLKDRVEASGAAVAVDEIPGGRLRFQLASFRYLLRRAAEFDVILCQEILRGSLNGALVGAIKGVPVITYMGIAPVEYFRCRRMRGQIGAVQAWVGESVIRLLMTINGMLASRCLVMGPYLRDVASRYSRRTEIGLYYGVDTQLFRPADPGERRALRINRDLPLDKFVIFLSSRISHEKDPETVLRAVALARQKGLDAVVINLGGGYKDFLALARRLGLDNPDKWVMGRPAAHPMIDLADYYRAADVVAQASLEEGAGMAPLEALASGTPAVCTAVGGMARILPGYARLTPKGNPEAMAEQFLWISTHRDEARAQALKGREHVIREWERKKAFAHLADVLRAESRNGRRAA
jgi:glycosyltransferase involved in cell wall biosynthesis